MPNNIPFTAYAAIVPEVAKGKFGRIRSRERIAHLIYTDLLATFSGNIASPGGDGQWALAASPDSISESVNIVAVKPQFGQDPDMVSIVGFYPGTGVVPYKPATILHDGQYVSGPVGAPGWNSNFEPSAANVSDVIAIKSALEAAVVSTAMTIIEMVVAGVRYGRGGYHFPQ